MATTKNTHTRMNNLPTSPKGEQEELSEAELMLIVGGAQATGSLKSDQQGVSVQVQGKTSTKLPTLLQYAEFDILPGD